MKLKNVLLLLITLMIILLPSSNYANEVLSDEISPNNSMTIPTNEHVKARVIEIIDEQRGLDYGGGMSVDVQTFKVEILTGEHKGKILVSENTMLGNPAYDLWVAAGDKVLLVLETGSDGVVNGYLMDYARDTYIFILLGLFILLLIVIGRLQGLKAAITLGITIFLIGKFMLPLLFRGYDPVLLALITSLAASTITFVAVTGWTRKSMAAILGTLGGLAAAAILSIIVSVLANLRGLSDEEAQMLLYIPQGVNFDFQGLLLAGIIIGALGAVMDVSMSIASSMDEINKKIPNLSFKELVTSGMNVGKDIMGTMSNTLILAYTGASIPLLLLLMAYEQPFIKLINMDFLATEFVRALCGSIGLILAIPITAVIAGFLFNQENIE